MELVFDSLSQLFHDRRTGKLMSLLGRKTPFRKGKGGVGQAFSSSNPAFTLI